MSNWNAKYTNDYGEYEITFASKSYEKAKVVEKICQAVMDDRVRTPGELESKLRVLESSGWTGVEERLPDAEQEVRVLCKASWNSCYRYQCQAFYEPKGMLREKSNYGWDYECCSEYSEEDDDYFVNPGWYERIHNWDDYSAVGIADEVTHWMPLPEAPKEEA